MTSGEHLFEEELSTNFRFVLTFEGLRKAHDHRTVDDAALHDIAERTGLSYEDLRLARSLRNALAHGERVNHDKVLELLAVLSPVEPQPEPDVVRALPAVEGVTGTKAYRFHARHEEHLEREMLANGFVSIGGAELDDLSEVSDAEVIRTLLTTAMPDKTDKAIAIFVGYWRRFLWAAQDGDLVVLPISHTGNVAIGELSGPYAFAPVADEHARHRRPVLWLATDVSRDDFDPDLAKLLSTQHTVQSMKPADAAERLRALASS